MSILVILWYLTLHIILESWMHWGIDGEYVSERVLPVFYRAIDLILDSNDGGMNNSFLRAMIGRVRNLERYLRGEPCAE
ncbi:MAG: hypothetical protein KKE50_01190 [Nanoarchaeota archaeon]|nr:hypothetical protein [Nanoarchaeota archaeon]